MILGGVRNRSLLRSLGLDRPAICRPNRPKWFRRETSKRRLYPSCLGGERRGDEA